MHVCFACLHDQARLFDGLKLCKAGLQFPACQFVSGGAGFDQVFAIQMDFHVRAIDLTTASQSQTFEPCSSEIKMIRKALRGGVYPLNC